MLLTAVSLHAFPFDNSAGALPRLAFFKTFLMGVPSIPGWCSIRFMYLYVHRVQNAAAEEFAEAQKGPERPKASERGYIKTVCAGLEAPH